MPMTNTPPICALCQKPITLPHSDTKRVMAGTETVINGIAYHFQCALIAR